MERSGPPDAYGGAGKRTEPTPGSPSITPPSSSRLLIRGGSSSVAVMRYDSRNRRLPKPPTVSPRGEQTFAGQWQRRSAGTKATNRKGPAALAQWNVPEMHKWKIGTSESSRLGPEVPEERSLTLPQRRGCCGASHIRLVSHCFRVSVG